ncbi:hypothetical protein GH141_01985, partial [bacterium]|nr:hypothetical protein [bacterium]
MSDYVDSLQARLAAERLSPIQAREGILESYVVTNRKAARVGIGDVAIEAEDAEVLRQLSRMMSDLFAERGGDFQTPSVSELRSIRHTMDLKLRFTELPPEISETHDMVCEILLEKAGASVFEEGAEAQPVQIEDLTEAATPAGTESAEASFTDALTQEIAATLDEKAGGAVTESPFEASLRERLALDKLSPEDARDGIIECFVATHRKSLAQEAPATESLPAYQGKFEASVRRMMREFFAAQGASFDEPRIELLQQARLHLEEKLGLDNVPEPILAEHNEVCAELIYKGRKFLEGIAVGIPTAEVAAAEEPREVEPVIKPAEVVVSEPGEEIAEEPTALPVEEIVARLRDELRELVRQEVSHSLSLSQKPSLPLKP